MPELPEVETTVNDLRPLVAGKAVSAVEVLSGRSIAEPSVEQFQKELIHRKIVDLNRRGKFLVFKLDNGKSWVVHLRMTGSLILKKTADEPEKFVRVIIRLEDGAAIHFRDMRKFGKMWLVEDEESVVGKLGLEPLSAEFTPAVLEKILDDRKTPVKVLLINQNLIAGIGNMYADEALYQARIHPLQPAGSLTGIEIKRLFGAIQQVLRKGIKSKGASTDTYLRPAGTKGEAHLEFQVAHRKGEECPVCGGTVERIAVGQRGTFFCPKCQKLHGKKE
jgi:formamidopyrimidine-DNA glycosylase